MKKHRLAALVAALLLAGGAEAQSPDALVRAIRADYEKASRQTGFRTVRRALTGESTEGGEIVGHYTRGGTLSKLTVTHLGEMGKHILEVHFLPQNRIFALDTARRYEEPFGKVVSTERRRFYLAGGKLVRMTREEIHNVVPPEGASTVPAGDPDAQSRTRELLADIARYRALLARRPQTK